MSEGHSVSSMPKAAAFGREIDLLAAYRDARRLLAPGRDLRGRSASVEGDTHAWEFARAQWHYNYGNRAMAERMLRDINMRRRLYTSEGKPGYPELELSR